MFGLALTMDARKRWKNGQPHHHTTGVAHASEIQFTVAAPSVIVNDSRVSMSIIAIRNTGAPNATEIQNRRVMSTSSGFGLSDRSGTRGSSAMPHFGHAPGLSDTTSGSIGQIHSTLGA